MCRRRSSTGSGLKDSYSNEATAQRKLLSSLVFQFLSNSGSWLINWPKSELWAGPNWVESSLPVLWLFSGFNYMAKTDSAGADLCLGRGEFMTKYLHTRLNWRIQIQNTNLSSGFSAWQHPASLASFLATCLSVNPGLLSLETINDRLPE